jgi:glycosyltransferase involved in cell wall biosynthesis
MQKSENPIACGKSKGVARPRFSLLFDDLRSMHLFKDVGQIPFQLHKHYGFDAEIVCRRNEESYLYVDDALKGLKLRFHGGRPYRYLLHNSRDIDILMLFHISTRTIYRGLLYKFLNPKGCLYVKADMNGDKIRFACWGERNFFTQAKRIFLFKMLLKKVDIVSFEAEGSFREVKSIPPEKKLLIPNGFDPDFIGAHGVRRRPFEEKENIILLVGRHGDFAKNSEFMLETLEAMADLPGWRVFFVGSMTADFIRLRDAFLSRNPQLVSQLVFTGELQDKAELFELYSRAKVNCLTSRWEGFPNVAVEGLAFGLVTVMPGSIACCVDITDNCSAGLVFTQGSPESLAKTLRLLMTQEETLFSLHSSAVRHFEKKFVYQNILHQLAQRLGGSPSGCARAGEGEGVDSLQQL